MRQHLKHIKTTRKVLADGTTRTHHYHRKTNKKIAGDLGSPEFLTNYLAASEPTKGRPLPGTLHALVESYFNSSAFGHLKPRTQQDYRKKSDVVGKLTREKSFDVRPSAALCWIADSEAVSCMICDSQFSFLTRKHHCRCCGGVFCNECCKSKISLVFLESTEPVRVCNLCLPRLK